MVDDGGLREQYSKLLKQFLESGDARYMLDIEIMSKKCVRANIGPDYMLEAHLNTLNDLAAEFSITETVRMFNSASEPLIQLMMGYATAYHEYIDMHEQRYQREKELSNKLNDANRLQEMFISIMSHDLRSPLSAIVGYSELIEMRSEDDVKIHGFANKIENAALDADRMIENMRTYSKLKRGLSDEDFNDIDLCEMLTEILSFLDEKIKEHGTVVDIKYQTDGRYPVHGTGFLQNAFINIIDNSIKYSPKNSAITLTIDEDDSGWRFGVADHGDGVPDEMKESVFERFVRNNKRGIKGSGIGLAITKYAVELHHGKVWIEDNPGGGCIFNILVPKA
ncbi:MAG: HAMP domain-containing sensor histidine kinase [Euryarchaeota archaeon]|nr:HAMP domain-containing sensor histidine kinase [Euryarchaeota archaeon]